MQTQLHIRQSLQRARDAFERRPSAALQQDSAAVAIWQDGLTTRLCHPSLPGLQTDLPAALGGEGSGPSPGWYFRAGVASCMATSIVMEAALRGIAIARLEVEAHSESDARGMLGVENVPAGPMRFWLKIALEAPDASQAELRALVASADAHSPMTNGMRRQLDVGTDFQLAGSASR